VTHLRVLDAHAEGTDWREVARTVLHLDPEHEPVADPTLPSCSSC
jgi:hypothetical protein